MTKMSDFNFTFKTCSYKGQLRAILRSALFLGNVNLMLMKGECFDTLSIAKTVQADAVQISHTLVLVHWWHIYCS